MAFVDISCPQIARTPLYVPVPHGILFSEVGVVLIHYISVGPSSKSDTWEISNKISNNAER